MDTATIRIKDRAVAVGVAVLSLLAFGFVYRSANDRHELEKLREQNRLLAREIGRLDASFGSIRTYTKTADRLAAGEVSPSDFASGNELAAAQPAGLFGRLTLAARAGVPVLGGTSDLESFAAMLATLDDLNRDTDVVVRRLASLAAVLKSDRKLMRSIPSIPPVEGARIASQFGMRLSPFDGKRHFHAGLDLAAVEGSAVKAPADGVVTYVGDFDSLGKSIVVNHGNGMLTRYGHLSRTAVRVGATVKRGQVIADVGNTGRSTGPHLHYEIWVRNVAVNPSDFFFDLADRDELLAVGKSKGRMVAELSGMGGDE